MCVCVLLHFEDMMRTLQNNITEQYYRTILQNTDSDTDADIYM